MVTRARIRPDIMIQDRDGQPIAIVEIKNHSNLSRMSALEVLDNLKNYGALEKAPFTLVLSQDKGFLWKERSSASRDMTPVTEFSMEEVIRRYLPNSNPNDRLAEVQLEMLVFGWLLGLTTVEDQVRSEPETTLSQAGFLPLLKDAVIIPEPRL